MLDSDDYLHASNWSIKLTEICMIHWEMPNETDLSVKITHKYGSRFLSYANSKDLEAIARLRDVMEYPHDLPNFNK